MRTRQYRTAHLRDKRVSAPQSVQGVRYQASAWVRATGRPVKGVFELYEWQHNAVAAKHRETFTAKRDSWRRVTFLARAQSDNSALQLSLTARHIGGRHGLKVDRVRLQKVLGPTPTPAPSVTPTATGSPPSPSADTLFGASVYESGRRRPRVATSGGRIGTSPRTMSRMAHSPHNSGAMPTVTSQDSPTPPATRSSTTR